jgi:hypothetical protein
VIHKTVATKDRKKGHFSRDHVCGVKQNQVEMFLRC